MKSFLSDTAVQQRPFNYTVIDNFLPEDQLAQASRLYKTLSFRKVHTDLYRFLQTNELCAEKSLGFFRSSLDRVFESRVERGDTFYSIFASFYRKGDFLLCHDDMVDQRLYAFTFYLEDFDSGKLIIYENDCRTVHESVDVRRNRLVIFEVQRNSFHEVDLCTEDGRKAFTGWVNVPDKENRPQPMDRPLSVSSSVEWFDLAMDIEEDFMLLEFKDIESREVSRSICGPFIDRRCTKIELDKVYAPLFPGYELIHDEYLLIDKGGYILCNDKINLAVENVLDVFIFQCEENVPGFLNYVDQNSNVAFTVDALNGHMLIGKRHSHSICIHRSEHAVFLKHYMYRKSGSKQSM